jgi:tyrosyl-tRNA synthetase
MANAYDVLEERGLIYQCSDEDGLRRTLSGGPITFYAGFDPSANSLQIGNIVPVMAMAHLQRAGHRPIAVVGGGTTMIGDPTDRTESRRIMSREEIDANAQIFKRQLARYVDLSAAPQGARGLMVDNAEWLLPLNYIEFLRDYGRHFSVNEMLRAETYRSRLETGLTFLEFNYMLLQAFDFLELYRRYGCVLQIGGSDQWSNILAGADLIRKVERAQAFALTVPLVTNAAGVKMGKTAGGETVWLDPARTSPYEFYQYWINTDDADVARYLAVFTFLPMDEIRALTAAGGAVLRGAKERLAYEATALAHGEAAARRAQGAARALFGGASAGGPAVRQYSPAGLAEAALVPTTAIEAARLDAGIPAVDLLVLAGLADSKAAARRLIEQGGAYLNGERLAARPVGAADLRDGAILLRAGKKRYQRVVPR